MFVKYDIIVIGAGSGGLNIAGFMNKVGFKTLLIDKSDRSIGGDCLNFGCVPSKALIHISRLLNDAYRVRDFGIQTTGNVDIKRVMDYVKSKQEIIREHENADYFRGKGMDVALGPAKFSGRNEVTVNSEAYTAKKIVIATGSRPRMLSVPGIENAKVYTNETIFDIDFLPENLTVIGGGPIGIELGQSFLRLGSNVTVVEQAAHFLPKEMPEISDVLYHRLKNEGMQFYFNTEVQAFNSDNELILKAGNGQNKSVPFNAVLVSVGRELNIDGIGLEDAGIETANGRIVLNEKLQTTNPDVLVVGDAAGSYQFTHAAELHAGVVLNNFFSPLKKKLNNDYLSWVTYTSPEIATFGLNERTLRERGVDFETVSMDLADDDRAITDDATEGRLVMYIAKGKIIGGSMVAENAGELFQELALAMSAKLNVKHLFNKTYPYPTASRINKSAILQHMSGRLTPLAQKFLHVMY